MIEEDQVKYNRRILFWALLVFTVLAVIAVVLGFRLVQEVSMTSLTATPIVKGENSNQLKIYPNRALTPGDVFSGVTKEVICVSGYSKTVRDVPLSLKKEVYAKYNISFPQPTGSYELDHFIPLALGGSNDAKNLWPEPALPKPRYHEKDVVEVYLLDQVCHHGHDLLQAQEEVRTDWYKVYQEMPKKESFLY